MLTSEQVKAAYRGDAIPDGLTGRVQYICLRRVYAGYRAGEIGREEAEGMKGYIMRLDGLRAQEKKSVLRYCFALLCEDAGNGDLQALADSKEIARALRGE